MAAAKRPKPKAPENRAVKLWPHRRRTKSQPMITFSDRSKHKSIIASLVILVLYLCFSCALSSSLQQQQQQRQQQNATTTPISSTPKPQNRRPFARQLFGTGSTGELAPPPLSLIGGLNRASSHDLATDLSGGGGGGSLAADAPDPMEPCYLANNRASESLTISESTPVGTVVGEIMVSRRVAQRVQYGATESNYVLLSIAGMCEPISVSVCIPKEESGSRRRAIG